MARVVGYDNQNINRASVSSISFKVTQIDSTTGQRVEVVPEAPLNVNDVIFDTLQTDAKWTKDAEGYNLAYQVEPTALPRQNETFDCDFKLVDTASKPYIVSFSLQARDHSFAPTT